jgi:hypothetical protein
MNNLLYKKGALHPLYHYKFKGGGYLTDVFMESQTNTVHSPAYQNPIFSS